MQQVITKKKRSIPVNMSLVIRNKDRNTKIIKTIRRAIIFSFCILVRLILSVFKTLYIISYISYMYLNLREGEIIHLRFSGTFYVFDTPNILKTFYI